MSVMADKEDQLKLTSNEIKKFRKKLRQIKNLEELDRDLSEEELLKISKKDEFRSKVQHLVAKFEELKSDAQKMETEQTHVEAASIDQEEQRANESTELLAETNGNSHEDAPIEIPEQDTNEATVSQADNQAFVLEARPAIRIPDVVLEAQTRRAPLLPSDSMTMRFHVRNFEGHNDIIYGVDCQGSVLVSGGRDTMLKFWNADTGREIKSMGGHSGTITSVLLVPKENNGQITRSMYAFSPVECLDCNCNNITAAGLDVALSSCLACDVRMNSAFLIRNSGTSLRSVRGHDEDAVTAIKFQDDRVVSGSACGVVKIWDVRDNSLKPVMSSEHTSACNATEGVTVKPRRVRCLATTQDAVYWGDDGVNMKAMDLKTCKLRKIRNHVTEFGCTGAMATTGKCLVSAGYDLDRGNGYMNVRSLPSEEYLATVDDENTGCITCLSCTETTSDKVTLHRMCSGGLELKVWDQLPRSKVKKRTRPETDDVYVSAKHVRRYGLPDISDTESSEEDEDQPGGDDSDDEDDVSNTGSTSRSWCAIS
ncbi:PREDICTED: uncharacterized protein LOC107345169 [Acropora digitifera]|uniref:uncharacterized protein LOC107345169 n=1 Tax=Acropora digitifera TaxID=70779 RepID=UPI00077AF197|nr:PREDICTED: uncharacterized protein LOC107345169 [Acropora digitifera]